jgi:hypothetical protein
MAGGRVSGGAPDLIRDSFGDHAVWLLFGKDPDFNLPDAELDALLTLTKATHAGD